MKFTVALVASIFWTTLSTFLALPWLQDLAGLAGWRVAIFIAGGTEILPGTMIAFVVLGLLYDTRPPRKTLVEHQDISILMAACNEENPVADTLHSIARQHYPGEFAVLVIDDGSTDTTVAVVDANPNS